MRDCVTQSVTNNVRLVLVGLNHEMSYTAESIRDSIRIRIVTRDSIRIRFECKRPIRRSLNNTNNNYTSGRENPRRNAASPPHLSPPRRANPLRSRRAFAV